jgi:hypothetical protein
MLKSIVHLLLLCCCVMLLLLLLLLSALCRVHWPVCCT